MKEIWYTILICDCENFCDSILLRLRFRIPGTVLNFSSGSAKTKSYGSGSGAATLILLWMKNVVSPSPSRRLRWPRAGRRWRRPPEVLDWTRSRSDRSADPPAPSRGTSRPPPMLGQCFNTVTLGPVGSIFGSVVDPWSFQFRSWPSRRQQKTIYIIWSKIKKSQNSRNQGFLTIFAWW